MAMELAKAGFGGVVGSGWTTGVGGGVGVGAGAGAGWEPKKFPAQPTS